MHNSASEWMRYRPASHHSPTWKLLPAPAKVDPNTRNRKPAPTPISAIENLIGIDGSRPRLARLVHSMLITGAKRTMQIGLKFWVCGAEMLNRPNTLRSVLRSANRVSDEPACSNKVQKKTLNTISTIAAVIICASVRVPFVNDQTRIPGTAMMNVPNSNLPISDSDSK